MGIGVLECKWNAGPPIKNKQKQTTTTTKEKKKKKERASFTASMWFFASCFFPSSLLAQRPFELFCLWRPSVCTWHLFEGDCRATMTLCSLVVAFIHSFFCSPILASFSHLPLIYQNLPFSFHKNTHTSYIHTYIHTYIYTQNNGYRYLRPPRGHAHLHQRHRHPQRRPLPCKK